MSNSELLPRTLDRIDIFILQLVFYLDASDTSLLQPKPGLKLSIPTLITEIVCLSAFALSKDSNPPFSCELGHNSSKVNYQDQKNYL